jgi:hypothetical protein
MDHLSEWTAARIAVLASGSDGRNVSHTTAAVGTFQGVDGPDPHEKVGPGHTLGALGSDGNRAVDGRCRDDEGA